MNRIYEQLQNGEYPNSVSLAMDLEVSQATARRDLEFMRERWNLPIEYDVRRHGYHFTRRVEHWLRSPFDQAEALALKVARKALAQYPGTSFPGRLDRAFEKAARALGQGGHDRLECLGGAISFRPFGPEPIEAILFRLVTRAIERRRALVFEYHKPGEGSARLRRVYPYHLVAFENRWYLLAYDVAREDIRKFVLGRMRKPRLLVSEGFEPPKDFDPERYLESSLGMMTGAADYEVGIEMDAWLTAVLRGRRWHRSQVWIELPGGGSYLRLRLSCLDEIEQRVLSWGPHATVRGPIALVERLAKAAQELAKRYAWVRSAGRESVQKLSAL